MSAFDRPDSPYFAVPEQIGGVVVGSPIVKPKGFSGLENAYSGSARHLGEKIPASFRHEKVRIVL